MKKVACMLAGLLLVSAGFSAVLTPRADLVVKKVDIQPQFFQPGEEVQVVVTAANIGKADSIECQTLVMYNNTGEKLMVDTPAIAAKDKVEITATVTLGNSMEHAFLIKLDAKTQVPEDNKINNRQEVIFKVKPKPVEATPVAAPVKAKPPAAAPAKKEAAEEGTVSGPTEVGATGEAATEEEAGEGQEAGEEEVGEDKEEGAEEAGAGDEAAEEADEAGEGSESATEEATEQGEEQAGEPAETAPAPTAEPATGTK